MLGRDQTRNPVSHEGGAALDWDLATGRNVKWRAKLGSISFAAPVVANGLVWVGTNNEHPRDPQRTNAAGVLMCFRERDGQFLYQHVSPARQGAVDRQALTGNPNSPFIEGGRLWFVTTRSEVACLDIAPLERGQGQPRELWKLDMIEDLGVSPHPAPMGGGGLCSIAGFRNRIYVITGNGTAYPYGEAVNPRAPGLVCLNSDTGDVLWEDNSSGRGLLFGEWGSPLAMEIHGRPLVVAPQGDGWIRSFDALTGELIWKFDINPKHRKDNRLDSAGFFSSAPVFCRNRLYIALGNYLEHGELPGRLVCLDPSRAGDISVEIEDATGQTRPNPNSGALWVFDGVKRMMGSVAVNQGLVVAADFAGIVHCLDADTGQAYWTHDASSQFWASPLIVDDRIIVGDVDGHHSIFALSKNERLVAKCQAGEVIASAPVFANGVIYISAGDTLYAIEDRSPSWTQWRGPDRSNASREAGLLTAWPPEGPPRLWSVAGLGDNIHSVAVAQGTVYTIGSRNGSEFVIGFDEATGTQKWISRVGHGIEQNKQMRWLSQRAPTLDGARLFWLTLEGDLVCLSTADGSEIWRRNYLTQFGAGASVWGYCDFPFVDGPALICTPLGTNAAVAALDRRTGETLWKSVLDPGAMCSYAPTVVSQAVGLRQYVVSSTLGLFGVGAADGKLLWQFARPTRVSASTYTPAVFQDLVCSPNGYGNGIVGVLLAKSDQGIVPREHYRLPLNLTPFQDGTAWVGDRLYLVRSNVVCLELKSGQILWGDTARGQGTAMTYADGHLYLQRASGVMQLLEVTDQGAVASASFSIPGHEAAQGVTSPVVVGGRLYIRDSDLLHCYAVSSGLQPTSIPAPRTLLDLAADPDRLVLSTTNPALARTGVNRAPDAVYLPTPQEIVEEMLKIAKVRSTDRVVDLGSGDGRFIITSAKLYGAHSVGYEIDARLVEQSRRAIKQEGLESLARIEHEDLFTLDLQDADVVTVFLYPRLMERLIPQLEKLKPGARIVSHQFEMPGIKPDREWVIPCKEDGEQHRILLWTAPLRRD
jgi:outer membrane protein assembly factor BamB